MAANFSAVDVNVSWPISVNAKRLRRIIYEQFLKKGCSDGMGALLEQSGLSPEDLKHTVRELQHAMMLMCVPGTLDVAKCPPWSNIPTRHAVELHDKHICHAGCMLEAMNIAYCYPDEMVTIRTACPQTGHEIIVRLKGNEQVEVSPSTVVGHVGVDPHDWDKNWFHACDNNNFFISAEAVGDWELANPQHKGVMLTMEQLKGFAQYNYRLDFERGADPNSPDRSGTTLFGRLGVKLPAHWHQ